MNDDPVSSGHVSTDVDHTETPDAAMKRGAPRVAIITLNWNGLADTLECLASLADISYPHYQIIVVDNGSREDPGLISERYPEVKLIRAGENLGFAAGNNVGINLAARLGFDYCWILNNDAIVTPEALTGLVSALELDSKLGAVTNWIGYASDRSLSWFAGGILTGGIPTVRGYYQKIDNHGAVGQDLHPVLPTDYLCGCSILARTHILQSLGGFDEKYFCYVEDVDLSLRIEAHGYRIGFVPDVVVWHKASSSTAAQPSIALYYKYRNMLYYINKFGYPRRVAVRWWLSAARFIVSLLLKHRNPKSAWYLALALTDAVRGQMGKSTHF